jgi:nucleotide-binding universal stress UspA family protein
MRILLATDGKEASYGAIQMAVGLERELGAPVRVVRALQPAPVFGPASSPLHILPVAPVVEELTRAAMAETQHLLARAGPEASRWPVAVELGPVPLMIVSAADAEETSLIVLGAGRHERIDRWFGTETALRVMQLAHVPVLAVPQVAGARVPRKALVAVDFSSFSADALEAAARVCGGDGELHLAYVLPHTEDILKIENLQAGAGYQEKVQRELGGWAAGLDVGASKLIFHGLDGKIAEELLRLANEIAADLIAAGSHGLGFFGRAVLGSVTTRLLRGADCSVLIAPPRERSRELELARGAPNL